jgi:4-hydroxy-tetrahydrodipicolinate reductase
LKIALFGYGKMGHMLEEIAIERGHEIVLKINTQKRATLTHAELSKSDVAIEFTSPDSAVENIRFCIAAGVPVVVGTTGWYNELAKVKQEVTENNGSLVYASNFSIGVNMVFAMNRILAGWMNSYPDYEVEIEEIHHTQKLDSPSGTAITLAEGILENLSRKNTWQKQEMADHGDLPDDVLRVAFDRKDGVPGIHQVAYKSGIDEIKISHEAFNRKGFALGAVLAAEFINGKKGIFTANDIFGF